MFQITFLIGMWSDVEFHSQYAFKKKMEGMR